MKVSRPQHLMNPVEKWGSPAANEAVGSSSGEDGGNWAELLTPQSWTEPRARLWMKDEPFWTNLFENRQAFMNYSILVHLCYKLVIANILSNLSPAILLSFIHTFC